MLFFAVAVLAWVLIQQSLATQLEHSTHPSIHDIIMPDVSDITQETALEWAIQAQQYGYKVAITLQPYATTIWLQHPVTHQWEAIFVPRLNP